MPDAAIIRSLRTGKYLAANAGFEALTGYPLAEIVGRSPAELGVWVDPDDYQAGLRQLERVGIVKNYEARLRKRDGRITIGLISAVRIQIEDESYIVSFVRDITQHREAERRQLLRDDLVAMLSHDIRTPLANILNGLFLLRRSSTGGQETQKLSDVIESSTRNALSLAQNFLDVARIESGCLELEPTPASLNAIVEHVVGEHRVTARARGVEIHTVLGAELPELELDVPLVERAIANLLSNGVKFSPPGHAVVVTTSADREHVRLSVADSGPGIPAGRREALFRRYERGAVTTSDSTGLGLYVIHTFIAAHGGEVSVVCPDDVGSVFTVTLPIGQRSLSPRRR